MKVTPSTDARQAGSRLDHRLAHLARVGLLALAVGLPVALGGAPTLASAGATVVAAHVQPGQIQNYRPYGGCPGDGTPC